MEPMYGMPREEIIKKKRREDIFRAFFSGFDFFLGGGYCEDLHLWVRHVVTPLTCGYTWSSMWLHLAHTCYTSWNSSLLSPIVPLLSTCSLCEHVSFRASMHMLCFVIFYCALCIQLLCTYYCASPFVYVPYRASPAASALLARPDIREPAEHWQPAQLCCS